MGPALLIFDLIRRYASLKRAGNARGFIHPKFDHVEVAVGLVVRVVAISSTDRIPIAARPRNYKSNLTDHLLQAFVTRRARLYVSIWQPTLS